MQDYRKLHVWQKAHQLAIDTYTLPQYFLKPEAWPLRDQIMKSAISIPSNIAEAARALADYQRLTAEGKLGEAGQKLEELKRLLDALTAKRR